MRRTHPRLTARTGRMGIVLLVLFLVVALTACAGDDGAQGPPGEQGPQGEQGPAGPAGPAGEAASMEDLGCTECHDASTVLTGKETSWGISAHGMGTAFVRGASASCVGCHSGGGFSAMIAAGGSPDAQESGDPNPTRQDCRACHAVHETYTTADWALETTDAVTLYAFEDLTFDGGTGNLCANCHQPRRTIAEPSADGTIEVTSVHWGPHHGPQSAMLLGAGGGGDVTGAPMAHALDVPDTCVTCHLGETADHTFGVSVDACLVCHSSAEDFDLGGVQTEVAEKLELIRDELVAKGMLVEEDGEYHPVVGVYPAAEAQALWNWIFIELEDSSLGIHNPKYTLDLLDASLEALGLATS